MAYVAYVIITASKTTIVTSASQQSSGLAKEAFDGEP